MPIKEIIALTTAIVIATAVTGGPQNLEKNLNSMKYTMLKELTRTDNWGNPSPFSIQPTLGHHAHRPHSKQHLPSY